MEFALIFLVPTHLTDSSVDYHGNKFLYGSQSKTKCVGIYTADKRTEHEKAKDCEKVRKRRENAPTTQL